MVVSLVFWYLIKATLGLRVSAREEEEGLDLGEHGQEAYHISHTFAGRVEAV
jgi:Amt family ammonium transporter